MPTFDAIAYDFPPGLVGTVALTVYAADGTVVQARTTAGIIEIGTATGVYRKMITQPVPGRYLLIWDDGGSPPSTAVEELDVPAVPTTPTPVAGFAGGPCEAWITYADLPCSQSPSPIPDDARAQAAINQATALLFEATGRRYTGICQRRVRPCRQGCACWVQRVAPATYISPGGLYTGTLNGWDQCGCGWLSTIELVGPVTSIVRVDVGADELSPAAYRLDRKRLLVRVDGGSWPACQNMAAAVGDDGAFAVTYTTGAPIPAAARAAAADLACELYAASWNRAACRLPVRAIRKVTQGVTVDLAALNLGGKGGTGVPSVDSFLSAAPRSRRMAVWTPGRRTPRPG